MTALDELMVRLGLDPNPEGVEYSEDILRQCAKVVAEATHLESVSLKEVADHLADEEWFGEVPDGIRKLADLLEEDDE